MNKGRWQQINEWAYSETNQTYMSLEIVWSCAKRNLCTNEEV